MEYLISNERNVQIVLSLLKEHHIKKVIASPGATNITFIASMQQDPYFEMYSCVDERSAAYIACGLAAESGEPVVLSCTGATSSRNYMPALTEAYYRKLPIIAITSSQVNERIGHLSAQCTDRRFLPKDVAKLSVQLPPIKVDSDIRVCELRVNQALLECKRHGGGPVHLNLCTTYSPVYDTKTLPKCNVINRIVPSSKFPDLPQGRIGIFVASHKKWSKDETEVVEQFCESNNAVVFCDHTSGYKGKYRMLFAYAASQEHKYYNALNPDLLIHIGEVSGDYYSLRLLGKQCWRVNPDGEIRDKFGNLSVIFEMDEIYFFKKYIGSKKSNTYFEECMACDKEVRDKLPQLPFSNIWMASILAPALPEKSVLHLGILNSLRSWNFFEIPNSVMSYSNVGGFGIDGDISSLVGASLAAPDKLFFGVLGDLAFFYDLNVLGNHHIKNNIRLLLINNGRGTEFRNYGHQASFLGNDVDKYVAAAGHFGNKSRDLIQHFSNDLGFEYMSADSKETFLAQYQRFLSNEKLDKPILFEVFTDSADESEALRLMRNTIVEKNKNIKSTMKGVVKEFLPGKAVKTIKKIMNN